MTVVDLEELRARRIEAALGVAKFGGARVANGKVIVAVDGDDEALVFSPAAAKTFALGLIDLALTAEREGGDRG